MPNRTNTSLIWVDFLTFWTATDNSRSTYWLIVGLSTVSHFKKANEDISIFESWKLWALTKLTYWWHLRVIWLKAQEKTHKCALHGVNIIINLIILHVNKAFKFSGQTLSWFSNKSSLRLKISFSTASCSRKSEITPSDKQHETEALNVLQTLN